MRGHIVLVHEEKKYSCPICGEKYRSLSSMKQHFSKVHRKKNSTECPICGQVFSQPKGLNLHLSMVHLDLIEIGVFECTLCLQKFRTNKSRATHIDRTHKGITVSCPICHQVIKGRGNLSRHIKEVHLKTDLHQCPICKKVVKRPDSLKNHMISRHQQQKRPFSCSTCSKEFVGRIHLRYHTITDHTHPNTCHVCMKRFESRKDLRLHFKSPHGTSTFCRFCEKDFLDLRTHTWINHSNDLEKEAQTKGRR